ncbi:hypothetical protein L195_g010713, partial [Trifolium pratense]
RVHICIKVEGLMPCELMLKPVGGLMPCEPMLKPVGGLMPCEPTLKICWGLDALIGTTCTPHSQVV